MVAYIDVDCMAATLTLTLTLAYVDVDVGYSGPGDAEIAAEPVGWHERSHAVEEVTQEVTVSAVKFA